MPLTSTQTSILMLTDLKYDVNLGWTDEEKARKQPVFMNISIRFLEPLKACVSDNLQDTHCYAGIIKALGDYINQRHFRLVEHLAAELYSFLKKMITTPHHLTINIKKKPTIENLMGEIDFCYGDE